jgi:hypothetical protein
VRVSQIFPRLMLSRDSTLGWCQSSKPCFVIMSVLEQIYVSMRPATYDAVDAELPSLF